jgi:hypothetical protein
MEVGLRRLTIGLATVLMLGCGPGIHDGDDPGILTTPDAANPKDRGPPDRGQPPDHKQWACRDFSDEPLVHAYNLRAIVLMPYVHARGSYDLLGLSIDKDKVWVRETKPDYFEKGSCP